MKNSVRLAFIFTALLCGGTATVHAGAKDKTLDVYWIDSEGGGSTLIVTPNDESVLIDTGNPGGRDAARIIAAVKAAGLKKLDYVLITHWHVDHFGGAAEVAQSIPIGTIYQRAIPEGDPDGATPTTFPQRIQPFREIQAKREVLSPGVLIPLLPVKHSASESAAPKLELRCVAADQKILEPTAAQKKEKNPLVGAPPSAPIPPSDNDNSAVFVLTFGGFKFYDGGDLTWNNEAKLVTPYNVVGTVDVYQTDHHGLDVSNNPVLVQSLAPTVTVMNNGPHKGGKLGAFQALKSAQSIQASYQLHKSFNAVEENAPDDYIANLVDAKPADKCTANLIKMTVAADAKSYTISIPANGHTHTYETKAK